MGSPTMSALTTLSLTLLTLFHLLMASGNLLKVGPCSDPSVFLVRQATPGAGDTPIEHLLQGVFGCWCPPHPPLRFPPLPACCPPLPPPLPRHHSRILPPLPDCLGEPPGGEQCPDLRPPRGPGHHGRLHLLHSQVDKHILGIYI